MSATARPSKIVPRFKGDDAGAAGRADPVYRNPALLARVRTLPCVCCGMHGFTQAAHSNLMAHGKAKSRKASDAAIMALCGGLGSGQCHERLDSGRAMSKEERHNFINEMICRTYRALHQHGLIDAYLIEAHDADIAAPIYIAGMERGVIILTGKP